MLAHLRSIIYFFYEEPKKDDLSLQCFKGLISDFGAKFEHDHRLTKSIVKELENPLNKRLAHVTASRWRSTPKPNLKFYARHFDGIEADMVAFKNALPNELRQDWLILRGSTLVRGLIPAADDMRSMLPSQYADGGRTERKQAGIGGG